MPKSHQTPRSLLDKSPLPELILLLVLSVVLSGCATWTERTWLKAPGWSRGVLLGETSAYDPAPFVVTGDKQVVVLLADSDTDPPTLTMSALDQNAELAWSSSLPLEIGSPGDPELLWDGEAFHLFWLAEQSVFYMPVDRRGQPLDEPFIVSENYQASEFDAELSPTGAIALWFAGPRHNPGVYAKPVGDLRARSIPIDAKGLRPQLQFTHDGTLHAFWIQYPRGYEREAYLYSAFENGEIPPLDIQTIYDLDIPVSEVLHGPVFTLDQNFGYLIWSEEMRTGLSAGSITSSIISFDVTRPEGDWEAESLRAPVEYNLPFSAYPDGQINAGQRVDLVASNLATTGRMMEFGMDKQAGAESVAVFKVQADYLRRKSAWQIGALFLDDGIPTSYQLLSFTTRESTNPSVKISEDQDLYLTWLERGGGGRSMVYLATTDPEFRDSANRIRSADILQVIAESVFGLASGVVLFPFVLIWILAGIVVISLTWWARKEDQPLLAPGTLITLVLAIVAYWFAKTFMFPGIFEYVPFSAWIPVIPESWELGLRIGVPLAATLLSLYIAMRFTYLSQQRSPLFFMLIFGLIDGVMTLAIYGVIFWGEV